jgi:acetate kinase
MRANALKGMEFLGVKIDPALNAATVRGKEGIISTPDAKVKVLILATDEELMIAQDTMNIVKA